jgi:hypothetical protein
VNYIKFLPLFFAGGFPDLSDCELHENQGVQGADRVSKCCRDGGAGRSKWLRPAKRSTPLPHRLSQLTVLRQCCVKRERVLVWIDAKTTVRISFSSFGIFMNNQ